MSERHAWLRSLRSELFFHDAVGDADLFKRLSDASVSERLIEPDRAVASMHFNALKATSAQFTFKMLDQGSAHTLPLKPIADRHLVKAPAALIVWCKQNAADDLVRLDGDDMKALVFKGKAHRTAVVAQWLAENLEIKAVLYNGAVVGVELPQFSGEFSA